MQISTEVQQYLDLDVSGLETPEACANALKATSAGAEQASQTALGWAQMAIIYAHKSGQILNKAKILVPHGAFEDWVTDNAPDISDRSAQRWMKLAKATSLADLLADPTIKKLSDAYVAANLLPPPDAKDNAAGQTDKVRPPWSPIKFSTRFEDYTRETARDLVYEFRRAMPFIESLEAKFGVS